MERFEDGPAVHATPLSPGTTGRRWITVAVAAGMCLVDLSTMYRWIEDGTISSLRAPGAPGVQHVDEVEAAAIAARRARVKMSKMILTGELVAGDIEFDDDDLLTTGEAGLLVGTDRQNVYKWIRAGLVPAVQTAHGHHRIRFADIPAVRKLKERRQS